MVGFPRIHENSQKTHRVESPFSGRPEWAWGLILAWSPHGRAATRTWFGSAHRQTARSGAWRGLGVAELRGPTRMGPGHNTVNMGPEYVAPSKLARERNQQHLEEPHVHVQDPKCANYLPNSCFNDHYCFGERVCICLLGTT